MRACGLGVPDSDFPDLRVALGESALWRVFARAPLFLPFWIMPATRKAILLPRSKGIVSARVAAAARVTPRAGEANSRLFPGFGFLFPVPMRRNSRFAQVAETFKVLKNNDYRR